MFTKSTLIRFMAVPACVVWGVMELIALQRAQGVVRKINSSN
jgi:hypothetical protein